MDRLTYFMYGLHVHIRVGSVVWMYQASDAPWARERAAVVICRAS